MTNLLRVSVVALLASALAIVGCSDDSTGEGGTGGGTGATGGAGATGGTGATGGGGSSGSGGTGGAPCEQTCGVDNSPPPDGAPTGTAMLECSVMNIPIPLTFVITATTAGDLMDGDNEVTLIGQTIIPVSVVDLILNLAESSTIIDAIGDITTDGTPAATTAGLSPVPCEVCYEMGVEVIVNLNATVETFTVTGGQITFTLETVTVAIDAAGLELILTNGGDDPNCNWENDTPPEVTLSAPG